MSELTTPLFPPPATGLSLPARRGDIRDGTRYVLPENAKLRVNVALATGRPLLIRGEPGTGKSSLAAYVAKTLGWRYHEVTVTSRTEARDLLWRYRTLSRLNDAQTSSENVGTPDEYVEPQALWWALDPERAATYGKKTRRNPFETRGKHRAPWKLKGEPRDVVLIDEIDKADPEVPNDLLVVVGSLRFTILETGDEIRGTRPPLLMFTTNEERDLPSAFVRRCITLDLETPDAATLKKIGRKHYHKLDKAVLEAAVRRLGELREQAGKAGLRKPSVAELLDTLGACEALGVTQGSPGWKALTQATLWKAPPEDGV